MDGWAVKLEREPWGVQPHLLCFNRIPSGFSPLPDPRALTIQLFKSQSTQSINLLTPTK